MAYTFNRIVKLAIPLVLLSAMTGCATVWDMEKMQKQVDDLSVATNKANATAESASATSQEAKTIANNASSYSSAAVKSSEAAVGVAVQAQQSVNQATIAFPWMRMDPATGRMYMQWVVWPSVEEYMKPSKAPATSTAK